MTQRVFDIENEKDMQDLWDILPHNINSVIRYNDKTYTFYEDEIFVFECGWIRINWHDKTEITRPIQEATEQDIGKLCYFWNDDGDFYAKLDSIFDGKFGRYYCLGNGHSFSHCRRLTKQEIEELC